MALNNIYLIFLAFAILLDVTSNILLKLSNGFKHKWYAIFAILFVLASFTAFSYAINGMQLSIAYGIWGGIGLILTATMGSMLFNEHIRPIGWLGILLLIVGVILIQFS